MGLAVVMEQESTLRRCVRSARRQQLRLIGSVAWTVVAGLLALIAGTALGPSIANSGYDDQENRAPALLIALAAAAFLVALTAALRGGQAVAPLRQAAIEHRRGAPGGAHARVDLPVHHRRHRFRTVYSGLLRDRASSLGERPGS